MGKTTTLKVCPDVWVHLARADTAQDCLAYVPWLPHACIGYTILRDGHTERLIKAYGLERLKGVRQLNWMTPRITGAGPFGHTRFDHSLDVMVIALMIGARNKLSAQHMRVLQVAALTHDALSPAGGDSLKLHDSWCEDAQYPSLLLKPEVTQLLQELDLPSELLLSTIRNEGLLGTILDVADKLAYVSRDITELENAHGGRGSLLRHTHFGPLGKLLQRQKPACVLWKHLKVREGVLYSINVKPLVHFLKVRAHIFNLLYVDPTVRAAHFFGVVIAKQLWKEGTLDWKWLSTHTDVDVEALFAARMGVDCHWQGNCKTSVTILTFAQEAIARRYETTQRAKGRCTLLEHLPRCKPATHLLVRTKDGLKTLEEAFPAEAAEIAALAVQKRPWVVSSVNPTRIWGTKETTWLLG